MENISLDWQERFEKSFGKGLLLLLSSKDEVGGKITYDILVKFIQREITRAELDIVEMLLSEEIEMQVGDNINELLEYRGVDDCGKSMRSGTKEKILVPLVSRVKRNLNIE